MITKIRLGDKYDGWTVAEEILDMFHEETGYNLDSVVKTIRRRLERKDEERG